MSAAFLRELAEIIHYTPTATTGLTELHVEALRDTADLLEAQAKEIHERANAQLELAADKERLIYWLLRVLAESTGPVITKHGDAVDHGAALCLDSFGYAPHSERAIRMLELGEPTRRST